MGSLCRPTGTTQSWWSCYDYHCIAHVFSRFPFIILFLTFLSAFLASWLSVSYHGFPEFDDPYQGFKTRRTFISDRLVALDNLRTETKNLRIIENFPGERMSSVESKKRRDLNKDDGSFAYCSKNPEEGNCRIALEMDEGESLFSSKVIGRLCYFQKTVENSMEYHRLCEKDGQGECCPAWSLANFIAMYANKSQCTDVTEDDISRFKEDLTCCVEILINNNVETTTNRTRRESTNCQMQRSKASTVPLSCNDSSVIRRALQYTLPKVIDANGGGANFSEASVLKLMVSHYTMVVLPVAKDPLMPIFMQDFMTSVTDIKLPDEVVRLGGINFGTKYETFSQLLISDMKFVIVASVLIFLLICVFTKSVFITVISFGSLTLTLGVSYFLYNSVFCVPYFPFMNMLVAIIILGIGTDGTLILSVAWRRCRNNLKDEPFNKQLKFCVMQETLKETTPTLIITTCTTACAFYASMTSSIITIRCFSIFAGTSIIVSFVLIYFSVPTALLASDIILHHIEILLPNPEKNTLVSKLITLSKKTRTWSLLFKTYVCPWKLATILHKLTSTKWAVGCLLLFTSILIWGLTTVFYYPGYELPQTEQFQLLSYNHPIEKYDRDIEPLFEDIAEYQESSNLTFYFVWGIKAVDNGGSLNPTDDGVLEFDDNFTLSAPENQQWMHSFCKKLKNQSFYDLEANIAAGANIDSCMLDTMISWMDRECQLTLSFLSSREPCCNVSTFPYESSVFSQCVALANRDVYRTPAWVLRPDITGPKFFTTFANTKSHKEELEHDESYDDAAKKEQPIYTRMGDMATFVVRVRTNFHYSISYEKMAQFLSVIKNFFNESTHSAPTGLQNGFFMSSHFDFFDLQDSLLNDTWFSLFLSTGLCFIFIWISSKSFMVSLGAVISILAIVVVSSAILIQLFQWKLGVFEAIAVTVAVGLSDFTTHHSIEFAKRESITMMTSATFVSAAATVIMGLFMFLFSQVLVYQQIGSFFFVLVLTSWLYSVFFLSPLLLLLNILGDQVSRLCSYVLTRLSFSVPQSSSSSNCNASEVCNQCSKTSSSCEHEKFETGDNNETDVENLMQTQSVMVEKLKLLKKAAQETTV